MAYFFFEKSYNKHMQLKEILKNISLKEIIGNENIEIDNLSQDTREDFTQKTLYFAVPGTQVDGHDFIEQAIEKGSVAVVCERLPETWHDTTFPSKKSDVMDDEKDVIASGAKRNEAISGINHGAQSRNKNNNLPSGDCHVAPFHSAPRNDKYNKIASRTHNDITFILVDSVTEVMGNIVANFYGNPSEKLDVIAVTGTNGKTTIATLLYQAFLGLGKKAALFSTAGDFINGQKTETQKKASSSMEVIEFQKNLAKAVGEKCDYVCIEATSHALDQNRLNGTKIKAGIYTNLTQDHLDYHKDFEAYARAKQKLFSLLDEKSFALINIDDPYGAMMTEKMKAKILTYGNKKYPNPIHRDFVFEVVDFSMEGTRVRFNEKEYTIQLVGLFNMYNMLAVYGTLIQLGFSNQEMKDILANLKGARGRMELVRGKREGVVGIVDYAHTPDALENVLKTLQELPHHRIITVVGVGGDRDRKKRPLMAKIAQEQSDYAVYTSDNPRTEDPEQIFSDLLSGCDTSLKNYEKIEDREKAIQRAVELAQEGDIILVAGKGHEDYQIMGTKKIHFDDREVLERYLNE